MQAPFHARFPAITLTENTPCSSRFGIIPESCLKSVPSKMSASGHKEAHMYGCDNGNCYNGGTGYQWIDLDVAKKLKGPGVMIMMMMMMMMMMMRMMMITT
jgi:hypothetical protein